MLPAARITHQMQGRLRIRIPGKKRDGEYFSRVAQALSTCPGVDSVAANPLAASVLVIAGTEHHDEVIACARQKGLFDIAPEQDVVVALSHRLGHHANRFDDRMLRATRGHLDLNGLAVIGMGAGALWQLSRRQVLPEALTLLFYAASFVTRPRRGSGPADRAPVEGLGM
jgi:hypothetical protein